MSTIWIVLPILTLLMFELGLTLRPADFRLFLHRPRPVFAGMLGQIVVLPLVAWAIASVLNLPPLFAIGLVLIACCPGGSSSNIFSMLAGGDVALSVSLTAISSIVTLFTLPLVMGWATLHLAGMDATDIHLPIGQLIVQNIVLMLVPIVAGIIVKRRWPRAALSIDRVLSRLAFPALMLLATVFFIQHRQTIVAEFARLGTATTLLLIVAMSIGFGIALLFRLTRNEQRTLLIEIGMQNAAQAIAIAASPFVFNNEVIAIPAIIYALMMNVVLLIYVALIRRKRRTT